MSVGEGTREKVSRDIVLLASFAASFRSSVFFSLFYESQSFSPVPYTNQTSRELKEETKKRKKKERRTEREKGDKIETNRKQTERFSHSLKTSPRVETFVQMKLRQRETRRNGKMIPPNLLLEEKLGDILRETEQRLRR